MPSITSNNFYSSTTRREKFKMLRSRKSSRNINECCKSIPEVHPFRLPQGSVALAADSSKSAPITSRNSRKNRGKIVPMPKSHIVRTHSEKDMKETVAIAEFHDENMFTLLVNGMNKIQHERLATASRIGTKHHRSVDQYLENRRHSRIVENIVRTRNTSLDNMETDSADNRAPDKNLPQVPAFLPGNGLNLHGLTPRTPQQCAVNLKDVLQKAYDITSFDEDSDSDSDHEGLFLMDDL